MFSVHSHNTFIFNGYKCVEAGTRNCCWKCMCTTSKFIVAEQTPTHMYGYEQSKQLPHCNKLLCEVLRFSMTVSVCVCGVILICKPATCSFTTFTCTHHILEMHNCCEIIRGILELYGGGCEVRFWLWYELDIFLEDVKSPDKYIWRIRGNGEWRITMCAHRFLLAACVFCVYTINPNGIIFFAI